MSDQHTLSTKDMQRLGRGLRILESNPEFQIAPKERKVRVEGSAGGNDFAIVEWASTCNGIGLSCDCSVCRVLFGGCGSGLEEGDLINVWDPGRCYFNLPPDLLYTNSYKVNKFKNRSYSPLQTEDEYDAPSCIWIVTGNCCVEGVSP